MNKRRVVVSLPNANAYLREQGILAKLTGQKLGLEVEVIHAGDDAITQGQQLLEIIHSRPETRPCAFVVEPLTGAGLRRVAQAAVDDGIAWVISNCDVDYIQELRKTPETPVFATTQGQTEIGRLHGRQLAALLPEEASVLYIHGPGTSPVATQRRLGMQSTKPPKMRITTIRSTWNEEIACQAVGSWLRLATSRAEKFDLVAGQTHELALGARKAFQNIDDPAQQKKWLDLPFIGVGIEQHVVPLVKKHLLAAAVVTSLTMEHALRILAEALKTKVQPAECTSVDVASYPPSKPCNDTMDEAASALLKRSSFDSSTHSTQQKPIRKKCIKRDRRSIERWLSCRRTALDSFCCREKPLSDVKFPKWQKLCVQALLEPDPEKLFLRVLVAETAIFHRLHDLSRSPGSTELRAMDEMLKNLQRLLANAFTFPQGEGSSAAEAPPFPNRPSSPNRPKRQTQPSA